MFREMEDGSLLNIAWIDTYEVIDNTIEYILVNGTKKRQVFSSAEEAQKSAEDIGKPPQEYEDVNNKPF